MTNDHARRGDELHRRWRRLLSARARHQPKPPAAALADPRAAGQLLWGNPEPAASREAASAALSRLQQAKTLRPRQQTPLANHYRDIGRRAGLYLAADGQWAPSPPCRSTTSSAG